MSDRQNQNPANSPINKDIMFSNPKGVYKKGVEKRQTKMMKKIGFIPPFLEENEEIYLVTTGCSPISIVEQLVGGLPAIIQKRSLFIFTNHRIFHVPATLNYSYRHSITHIRYANCKSVKLKGRTLVVEYGDGKKEKFIYIAGREKKKIRLLLENQSCGEYRSNIKNRVHLCPRCTNELEKEKYTCSNCNLEFKNKAEGRKYSLLIPGGGYFYTRHPFLGLGDALTETFLLLLVLLSFFDIIAGATDATALVLFTLVLAFEKVVTVYHSNHFIKEFIPKPKVIETITSSARSEASQMDNKGTDAMSEVSKEIDYPAETDYDTAEI